MLLLLLCRFSHVRLCPTIDSSHPWDSPGKNTGLGCHFLLQCVKVKVKSLSRVWLLVISWTAAHQTPPSMGFSRQEYWSGVPLPSPKNKHKNILLMMKKNKETVSSQTYNATQPALLRRNAQVRRWRAQFPHIGSYGKQHQT